MSIGLHMTVNAIAIFLCHSSQYTRRAALFSIQLTGFSNYVIHLDTRSVERYIRTTLKKSLQAFTVCFWFSLFQQPQAIFSYAASRGTLGTLEFIIGESGAFWFKIDQKNR